MIRDGVQEELKNFTDPNREDVKLIDLFGFNGFLLFCFLALILFGAKRICSKNNDKEKVSIDRVRLEKNNIKSDDKKES